MLQKNKNLVGVVFLNALIKLMQFAQFAKVSSQLFLTAIQPHNFVKNAQKYML